MAAPIVAWRYIGGLRHTDDETIEEVCVQALTSVGTGSELGIARVEFYISYGGSAPVTATAAVMEECFSTHMRAPSLIPGAPADTSAWFPGFKIQLALGSLPFGTITITARAFTVAGSSEPLDRTITIFNDTDGANRAPSNKNVFVSPTGSDTTGTGTEGNPYLSPQKALQGEMGNSVVNFMAGLHTWGNTPGSFSQWWTSGGHRVIMRWLPGAVCSRFSLLSDGVVYNGTTPGSECNYYFEGSIWQNGGGVIGNDPSVACDVWFDGGLKYCEYWRPEKRWSVLTFRTNPATGFPTDINLMTLTAPGPNARVHATGFKWLGNVDGPNSFYSLQDCVISDFLGIGSYFFDRHSECNVIIEGQRLYRHVAGRVQGNIAATVVSVPVAGQMRIDATGPLFYDAGGNGAPMDISTLAEIVGTNHQFRAMVQFSDAPGNNGTFEVLSAGLNGSFLPYVILANPNAVAGAPGASTLLWTVSNTTPIPNDFVHPDGIYAAGDTQTNTLLYGVVMRDLDGLQTFFTSGHSSGVAGVPNVQTRFAMWNCRDGSNFQLTAQQFGTQFLDSCFYNNTIEGFWSMNVAYAATGTCFINNVVGQLHGGGAGFWPGMLTVSHNHLITGTPPAGTSWTTGAWFENDQRESPWSFQPTAGNLGTGSALAPEIVARRWDGAAGPTKGCWQDTGLFNWEADAPSGRDINLAFNATISVSLAATAELGIGVTGTAFIPVTLEGQFTMSGPSINPPDAQPRSGAAAPRGSFGSASAASPSDLVPLPHPANGFYSSGGDVAVQLEDGSSVVFAGVPAGKHLDLRIRRVNATGTTAATPLALY